MIHNRDGYRVLFGSTAAALLIACAAPAHAGIVYGFNQCPSNNVAGDVAIGFAQMTVEVSAAPGNTVDFIFRNSGPAAASITDLYWDDGSLLALASITNGSGTSFSALANPGNLPAGNNASPPFVTTAGFSADSNPPAQPNGVNPNEFVIVNFTLQGSQTIADVYSELASGALRIGIHVQGYASGGSESFINNPVPVPAPGALALLGVGGLIAARRRR